MKNLKPYEAVFESQSSSQSQGFIVLIKASGRDFHMFGYYVGICDTFYDFAQYILEDVGYRIKDWIELEEIKDIEEVMDRVMNTMEPQEFEYCMWQGLTPKADAHAYTTLALDNPYETVRELDTLFSNVKDVMLKYPNGNEDDLTYIARSVESRPEALDLYVDQPRFEKILNLTNMDPKMKKAMVSLAKTKGMI
jgi:hypothetical protein